MCCARGFSCVVRTLSQKMFEEGRRFGGNAVSHRLQVCRFVCCPLGCTRRGFSRASRCGCLLDHSGDAPVAAQAKAGARGLGFCGAAQAPDSCLQRSAHWRTHPPLTPTHSTRHPTPRTHDDEARGRLRPPPPLPALPDGLACPGMPRRVWDEWVGQRPGIACWYVDPPTLPTHPPSRAPKNRSIHPTYLTQMASPWAAWTSRTTPRACAAPTKS